MRVVQSTIIAICVGVTIILISRVIPSQRLEDITRLSTQYRYSQYCLQGYRDQHAIDVLLPEYVETCGNSTEFGGNIDDPELYTYAGITYLTGISPASINWETQPLTKYIFGISTSLFGTPLIAQLIIGLLILVSLYLLGRKVFPIYIAVIPPILLMLDPLFRDQLTHTYLDLSVTLFILLWLLYLGSKSMQKFWWVGGVILGSLSLSKSFSLGILAALVGFLHIYLNFRAKDLFEYFKTLLLSVFMYLLGYVMFFVNGHTLMDFARLHLNILRMYKSYVPEYPKGEIFRIIVTGQWRTWWGDKGLVVSPFWSPLWMAGLIFSVYIGLSRRMRLKEALRLHLIWILLALTFISLRLVFPRYLLPVLPSLHLMLVYGIYRIFGSISYFISRSQRA